MTISSKTSLHNTVAFSMLLAFAALGSGCQPEDILHNPEIERWCGNHPCSWHVVGKVERVGTWNADDYAASLESSHAELWQETMHIGDVSLGDCFDISMLTKIDPGVQVYLDVDFQPGDGADLSIPIPAGDFTPFTETISPPSWFDTVRFTVRKDGAGRALIAKLRVIDDPSSGCDSSPIEVVDRPLGANCETADQCQSHMCSFVFFGSGTCECPAVGLDGGDASADAGSCGCSAGSDGSCP